MIEAETQREDALAAGVTSFTWMCESACEARNKNCRSYLDRNRRCPDCPKQWAEELKAHIDEAFENYGKK